MKLVIWFQHFIMQVTKPAENWEIYVTTHLPITWDSSIYALLYFFYHTSLSFHSPIHPPFRLSLDAFWSKLQIQVCFQPWTFHHAYVEILTGVRIFAYSYSHEIKFAYPKQRNLNLLNAYSLVTLPKQSNNHMCFFCSFPSCSHRSLHKETSAHRLHLFQISPTIDRPICSTISHKLNQII
jgi:hypothetical protein